jgi:hypothetical protein
VTRRLAAVTHVASRAGVAVVTLAALAAPLVAQRVPPLRPTPVLRGDAILESGATTLHAGAGIVLPAGYQARIAIEGGVGGTRRDADWRPSARLDATARFLFDPFRETRWALSAGGGAGIRWERRARPRPVALVVVGVQGPADGRRWLRGIELGFGGGVRLGVTLGRPVPGRR